MPDEFERYVELGVPVSDDNQTLAYGGGRIDKNDIPGFLLTSLNLDLINRVVEKKPLGPY